MCCLVHRLPRNTSQLHSEIESRFVAPASARRGPSPEEKSLHLDVPFLDAIFRLHLDVRRPVSDRVAMASPASDTSPPSLQSAGKNKNKNKKYRNIEKKKNEHVHKPSKEKNPVNLNRTRSD